MYQPLQRVIVSNSLERETILTLSRDQRGPCHLSLSLSRQRVSNVSILSRERPYVSTLSRERAYHQIRERPEHLSLERWCINSISKETVSRLSREIAYQLSRERDLSTLIQGETDSTLSIDREHINLSHLCTDVQRDANKPLGSLV